MAVPENRERIKRIVSQLERIKYCIGPKGTQFWMREYEKYANQTGSILRNDNYSWGRAIYDWSQLFAFYKLWYVFSDSLIMMLGQTVIKYKSYFLNSSVIYQQAYRLFFIEI